MSASAPAPKDSPLMQAWEAYQATPEYSNSKGWAMQIAPMVQHGHPDEEAMRRFDIMPRAQREVHIQGAMWAAFMAGFNASRTEAPHEEQVLYCPGCGSVGPVPKPYQHCCPDHGRARMVPKAFAEQCAATFRLAIQKPVVVNGIPSSEDPPSLR